MPPGCRTLGCCEPPCTPWHGEVQTAARRAHADGSHGQISHGRLTPAAHTGSSHQHLTRTAHTDSGWHPRRPRHGPRWQEPAQLHHLRSTSPAPAPAPGPLKDGGFAPAASQPRARQGRQQQCAGHTTKAPQGPQAKPLWPCGPAGLQLSPPVTKQHACLVQRLPRSWSGVWLMAHPGTGHSTTRPGTPSSQGPGEQDGHPGEQGGHPGERPKHAPGFAARGSLSHGTGCAACLEGARHERAH